MENTGQLLVRGGRVVGSTGVRVCDVRIEDGRFTDVGNGLVPRPTEAVIDATGKLVFPGLVDPQVHFREPGNTHKEDLASGSRAAIAGGVTVFMEMPNTKPSTTTRDALEDKFARARGRVFQDHGFFVGATPDNWATLEELEQVPGCAGVKVFMGSSTGDLLVPDDAALERILASGTRRVTVHSEDEPMLHAAYAALREVEPVTRHDEIRSVASAVKSTTRLLNLAEKTGRRVHLLHVSTAEEIDLVLERDLGDLVTVEITPNHVFLAAPQCYERHGTWAQMNPPVRGVRHRDRLRQALADGTATCMGSDHAPHALDEKSKPYPRSPSGIPGVQTTLALLLTAVRDGWLRLEDIVRLCVVGPTRVYPLRGKGEIAPGNDGDLVLVDPTIDGELEARWLLSRSPCNPFIGTRLAGMPVTTVVAGRVVWSDGEQQSSPCGRRLVYDA